MSKPSPVGTVMIAAARAAGRSLARDFGEVENLQVSKKGPADFVSNADHRAEEIIYSALAKARPGYGFVMEERGIVEGTDKSNKFIVDPLDGTKEFVNKNGEFTVNIAIIEHGRPVMGVVYAPAKDRLFVAESHNSAWQAKVAPGKPVPGTRAPIKIRSAPDEGLTAVASKSHRSAETNDWLAKFDVAETVGAGSSLKFCLIAAGEADLYPRMGRTMEWDTAAGHAVVEAAGGRVLTEDGTPLLYGKTERGYDNPHFIVYGDVTPA